MSTIGLQRGSNLFLHRGRHALIIIALTIAALIIVDEYIYIKEFRRTCLPRILKNIATPQFYSIPQCEDLRLKNMWRGRNQNDREHRENGQPLLAFGGHQFHISRDAPTRIYVKCAKRASVGCNVTGNVDKATWTYHSSANSPPHRDHPQPNLIGVENCIRELRDVAVFGYRPPRVVYDEVMPRHAEAIRQSLPFTRVQGRLNDWCYARHPPNPRSYLALQEAFQTPPGHNLLRHGSGAIIMSCITAADGNSTAIIGDPAFAAEVPELLRVNISASEAVLPNLNETRLLISITAEHRNHAFTFGWALISELTTEVSVEMMGYIQRELMQDIHPAIISTNLDARMREAAQATWNQAEIRFTYHHYLLTLLHHVTRVPHIDLQVDEHIRIIRKLMILPWLPAGAIDEAFERLWQCMTHEVLQIFLPLLQWYRRNLILGVTPDRLTFYKDEPGLANIDLKIPSRLTLKLRGNFRPDIWQFHRRCLEIVHEAWEDIGKLNARFPNERCNISMTPKTTSLFQIAAVRRLWRLLDNHVITEDRFLELGPELIRLHYDFLIYNQDYLSGAFSIGTLGVGDDADFTHFQQPRVPRHPQMLLGEQNFDEYEQFIARERRQVAERRREVDGRGADEGALGAANDLQIIRSPYNWRCVSCERRPTEIISRPCNCVALCRECSQTRHQHGGGLICPSCQERAISFERVYITTRDDANDGDDPYEWTCPICLSGRFISVMGEFCHQICCCSACLVQLRAANRRLRCPACNIPGRLVEVNFRRIQ